MSLKDQVASSPKGKKALTWHDEIEGVWDSGKRIYNWWRERQIYRVEVLENDMIYTDVMAWFLSVMPPADQRKLRATTTTQSMNPYESVGVKEDDATISRVTYSYEGSNDFDVSIEGHSVKVSKTTIEQRRSGTNSNPFAFDAIVFEAMSVEGRNAVKGHLDKILDSRTTSKRPAMLYTMTTWGSWTKRKEVPLRSIQSVVLQPGQSERIVTDLQGFLDAESDYGRLDIPWHRGYLFHGDPGTGKTSFAKALAQHFSLDIFYAPLGDVKGDGELSSLLADVHPRSILLLEDIDVFAAAKNREEGDAEGGSDRVSLSGLLNSLDGLATPHGLIKILTTNVKSDLDDALVRAGRIDLDEEFVLPTTLELTRLFKFFYGRLPRQPLQLPFRFSAADISEIFKRHLKDPDGAEQTLWNIVSREGR